MVRKYLRIDDEFNKPTKVKANKLATRLKNVGFKISIKKTPTHKKVLKRDKYTVRIIGGKRKRSCG